MQTFVAHLDRLPEADRSAIRALVADETWRDIEQAGTFSWLPIDINLVCTRAVAQCLGPKRTDEFFRTLLLATFKTPLLQKLVDAVVRMLGSDPSVSLAWVSKGFQIMYKDSGSWRVTEQEPGNALLAVEGLPHQAITDRVWHESVASALGALFVIARVTGVTTIWKVDAPSGTVVFRLRWEQRES
jgi:hypothetical protein